MNWHAFIAIIKLRNLEFFRDRAALAWTILFPVLVIFGFAFAFSGEGQYQYKVGVYGESRQHSVFSLDYLDFVVVDNIDAARKKVERHQLDLLIDMRQQRYWINHQAPKGYLMEQILLGSMALDSGLQRQTVSGAEVRYVDWLMPGMLGMNMMFAALWGVGFVIVRYRRNGVLKRLSATPLTALEFIAAQLVSRLGIILVLTTAIYLGCNWILGFAMYGSYPALLAVFTMGTVCMISLSLIVAAWTANQELASGLLNLMSWPMMFLSGVWFSTEGFHPILKSLAYALPLTYVLDASRAIMIDGAGWVDVQFELGVLALLSIIFLAIGSLSFRWQ